jgi:hypothetical protein
VLACDIVPLVVIGLGVHKIPVPCEIFVTVPLGSSPDGIKFHELPLDINTSPIFADCDAYVPVVITLYVYPSLSSVAAGRDVIVPPVPSVPLNTIGDGISPIAQSTQLLSTDGVHTHFVVLVPL